MNWVSDEASFSQYVLDPEMQDHVRAIIRSQLRTDPIETDDLCQDMLLKAWSSWSRFRPIDPTEPEAGIRGWLVVIAKNSFINGYRKRKLRPVVLMRDGDDAMEFFANTIRNVSDQTVEDLFDDVARKELVLKAISELPKPFRSVVYLSVVEELPYKEIAERLDIAIGTVMSRLHRGRKGLMANPAIREYLDLDPVEKKVS